MGVLNVTPDSFSDGGEFIDLKKALKHTEMMIDNGADIIDIGGESSRPGAKVVSANEERKGESSPGSSSSSSGSIGGGQLLDVESAEHELKARKWSIFA